MLCHEVRRGEADDLPIIAAWVAATPLWQRYGLHEAALLAQLDAALTRGDCVLTADSTTQRACGLAWCLPYGVFGRSPYLKLFGVCQDQRGMGIGKALLRKTEALATEHAGDIFLLVSDFNEAAQRFYQRQGYKQVGALSDYVLPGVTELIFRKILE